MNDQKRAEAYHKSRLGRVLINKGYITEAQLDDVIAKQADDKKLLGEILLAEKQITRWQLRRALSSQTRLRFAASLSLALLENCDIDQDFPEIEYQPEQARADIKTDGTIRLRLPSSIGEIQFDHLRINSSPSAGYETLNIEDIDLSDADMSIRAVY